MKRWFWRLLLAGVFAVAILGVVGWLTIALGAVLTVLDFAIGMPASWSWGEGPPTIVVGVAFIWLAKRAGSA